MQRSKLKRAFTLIELLVVIAIIGVLVSLLLPAVQQAREAARMTTCRNNLKNIGLALHNYESTYSQLPMGNLGGVASLNDDGYTFLCSILPYLDQASLYNQIKMDGRPGICVATFTATGTIIPLGDTKIPAYKCPSSGLPAICPPTWTIPWGDNGTPALPMAQPYYVGYATTDYKGAGGSCTGDDGVLHKNSENPGGCKFRDITDGMSNTFMLGESSYVTGNSTTAPTKIEDWPMWMVSPNTDESFRINGRTTAPVNCGSNVRNMVNTLSDDCAFSYHIGGAMHAMCDGSVRFISENIAIQTVCALHSRAQGTPPGEF